MFCNRVRTSSVPDTRLDPHKPADASWRALFILEMQLHPALKALVQDPTLGLLLYALSRPSGNGVSTCYPQDFASYRFAMDNIVVHQDQFRAIGAALTDALGESVEVLERRTSVAEVEHYLPDSVKLKLLTALLEPEDP